ncbi:hypothetical protein C8R42DRAFT_729767, partial [Lentinula raphanica]
MRHESFVEEIARSEGRSVHNEYHEIYFNLSLSLPSPLSPSFLHFDPKLKPTGSLRSLCTMGTPQPMDTTSSIGKRMRSTEMLDEVSMRSITPRPTVARLNSDRSMLDLGPPSDSAELDQRPRKWRLQSREIADIPDHHKRHITRLEKDLDYQRAQLDLKTNLAQKQQEQIERQEEHIKNQKEQIEDLEDTVEAKSRELEGSQGAAIQLDHRYKTAKKELEVEILTRSNIEIKWQELNLFVAEKEENFQASEKSLRTECQTLREERDAWEAKHTTLQKERAVLEERQRSYVGRNKSMEAELAEERKAHQTAVSTSELQISSLNTRLQQTVNEYDRKISALEKLTDSTAVKQEYEGEIDRLKKQVQSFEHSLLEKDSQLAKAESSNSQLLVEQKNLKDSLEQKESQLEKAATLYEELRVIKSATEDSIGEKEETVARLLQERDTLSQKIEEYKELLETAKTESQRTLADKDAEHNTRIEDFQTAMCSLATEDNDVTRNAKVSLNAVIDENTVIKDDALRV